MTKQELETRLQTAFAQRTKAYKLGVPRYVISDINRSIRYFQQELSKVGA